MPTVPLNATLPTSFCQQASLQGRSCHLSILKRSHVRVCLMRHFTYRFGLSCGSAHQTSATSCTTTSNPTCYSTSSKTDRHCSSSQRWKQIQVCASPTLERPYLHGYVTAPLSLSACSKIFKSDEAQADLRFVELLDGENKILVISAVAPGSTAEKVPRPAMLTLPSDRVYSSGTTACAHSLPNKMFLA